MDNFLVCGSDDQPKNTQASTLAEHVGLKTHPNDMLKVPNHQKTQKRNILRWYGVVTNNAEEMRSNQILAAESKKQVYGCWDGGGEE